MHDLLFVREVLALDPYSLPKGSTERSGVWERIAANLNLNLNPKFVVNGRSVRDRITVLIKKYKKKINDEINATGIEVDPPTEFESAMEEICEKFDDSERDAKSQCDEKRERLEKEKKQVEEMRSQALEKIGDTKKRKGEDESQEKSSRKRRSGDDTITYLKEKAEQDMVVRQQELQLKMSAQAAQEKHQNELMQQVLKQQEQQQSIFTSFQQQQQQQLQQMNQVQLSLMQQQQQQSQVTFDSTSGIGKKEITLLQT